MALTPTYLWCPSKWLSQRLLPSQRLAHQGPHHMRNVCRTTTVWGDPKLGQGQDGQPMPAPQQAMQQAPQAQTGGPSAWGGAGLPEKRSVCAVMRPWVPPHAVWSEHGGSKARNWHIWRDMLWPHLMCTPLGRKPDACCSTGRQARS